MEAKEHIAQVSKDITERATKIVDEGHKMSDIMQSAYADFKSLGGITGMMSVLVTGKLNTQQIETIERIAVKVLAVLGLVKVK